MRIKKQTLAYFILSASIVSGASSAYSAAPPKELWGKSLTITWSESREQRPLGEQNWRTVSGSNQVLAYISDVGRIFSTGTTTTAGGTAQLDPRILGSKGDISAVFPVAPSSLPPLSRSMYAGSLLILIRILQVVRDELFLQSKLVPR